MIKIFLIKEGIGMEFREIVTFLQAAKLQSFSKAARQLGYSQAAVTIQIKQLEQELGVHLFDRIGKQTTLTHQGQVFYEYASAIMRDLAQAKDAMANPTELTGQLCLGTIESICSSIFPDLLTEYHRLHPKVNVNIITDSPDRLLEQMNANVIDIVYFLDKRIYDPKWEKVMEQPEQILFAASADHPLSAKKGELSLDEILSYPFVLTEKNASYRFVLDQYLASEYKRLHPFLETGNTDFILKFLQQNQGISFLPEFTIRQAVKEGRLCILTARDFHIQIWRQIVYHRDKWVTREMAEFLRLAKEMATLR